MNVHDSEKIAGVLDIEGYHVTGDPKDADLIVYNTCSIRQKAEQKFLSDLGRIKAHKKNNPQVKIAVAGCIAQQQGRKIFGKAPHVDIVLGPQNIHLLPELLAGASGITADQDNPSIVNTDLPVLRMSGNRALVSIMYGCDNFCSYCIVPFTRGREKSRPSENVLKEITELSGQGFKEVTLLGQNVNSYKSDIDFPALLRKINEINGIEIVRFMTSHPRDLNPELVKAIHELDRVCKHLHLPLQSGSDRILRLMRRGYTYAEYLSKIEAIRNRIPDISITSDIIVGFPGETDLDHSQTLKALKEIEFDGVYAFKYSPRKGTAAAKMEEHIEESVASQRLYELLDIQDSITLKLNKRYEDTTVKVLVEGESETDKSTLTGRTGCNRIVNFEGNSSFIGNIIQIKIVEAKNHSLRGVIP